VLTHRAADRGAFDDLATRLHRRLAQPEIEDRKLLVQIGCEEDDEPRVDRVVDRGARQREEHVGRQAVVELRIDRVRTEHRLRELRPRIGVLVGKARAADDADATGAVGNSGAQRLSGATEGLGPAHHFQFVAVAGERLGDTRWRVDRLVRETALVAEPALVDRQRVDTEEADELARRGLRGHAAADRTGRAGRLDLFEIPGAGLEPVGPGRQRADRTDLHRVAREVGVEGLIREGRHLDVVTTEREVDQRITSDLVGESRAARALDAALTVKRDEGADVDRLRPVPLLLDETALARSV
jgi:hypothetical protein